jgi:hypothetical protein
MKTIRIGCGQGFWGDSLEAPLQLVRQGPLQYLILDYLAEVTLSILARHKQKNPAAGYARDFVELIEQLAPEISAKGIRVLANAGGMNPLACAQAVRSTVDRQGLGNKIRIAVITGDDILPLIADLQRAGVSFENMENKRPLSDILPHLVSANVYLGAAPFVEALQGGADIIISGRAADPALALAPMIHEFSWPWDDWDRLASGIVAGHIIECGAQCSGGNCSLDWQTLPNLAQIGYPLVEVAENAEFVVTKHPGTGGRVSAATVKEQIVYEIGDPRAYITPDVSADFSSIQLSDEGNDRVRIFGVKGRSRPEQLKVSMSYSAGYSAAGTILYSWPDAAAKAQAAAEIVKSRLASAGLNFATFHSELIGVNACHGPLSVGADKEIAEVMLRVAVRDPNRSAVERFTREISPLVLNGPPTATAYFSRPKVQEVIAYWPALIPREQVRTAVSFV